MDFFGWLSYDNFITQSIPLINRTFGLLTFVAMCVFFRNKNVTFLTRKVIHDLFSSNLVNTKTLNNIEENKISTDTRLSSDSDKEDLISVLYVDKGPEKHLLISKMFCILHLMEII